MAPVPGRTDPADQWRVWFGKPGFIPPTLPQKTDWVEFPKYDPPARRPVIYYVLGQFVAVIAATVVLLFLGHHFGAVERTVLSLAIIITTASWALCSTGAVGPLAPRSFEAP